MRCQTGAIYRAPNGDKYRIHEHKRPRYYCIEFALKNSEVWVTTASTICPDFMPVQEMFARIIGELHLIPDAEWKKQTVCARKKEETPC